MTKNSIIFGALAALLCSLLICGYARNCKTNETYRNVDMLISSDAKRGSTVYTLGYYSVYDGGGAKYKIEDSLKYGGIALASGLYANPIFTNEIVNIKAVGAVGDGITDDSRIIEEAINSGYKTVSFPNATYACNSHIMMIRPNVTIRGNGSVLLTNDNFCTEDREWFFAIKADNISIDNLYFECHETHTHKFKTQLGIMDSKDVSITNCKFTIPHEVISDNPYQKIEYTNLDVYSGCYNVTIDNCTMIDLADSYAGLCCMIRDLYGNGSSTIYFTNNTCIHQGKDEMFGVFSNVFGTADHNTISDVYIENNKFYQSNGYYTRNVGMTLGGDNNEGANHVVFKNNYVESSADCMIIKFGSAINVDVSNNTIICNLDNQNIATYVFYAQDSASEINIEDNDITVKQARRGNYGLKHGNIAFGANSIIEN